MTHEVQEADPHDRVSPGCSQNQTNRTLKISQSLTPSLNPKMTLPKFLRHQA
jgi:hypothetical protein